MSLLRTFVLVFLAVSSVAGAADAQRRRRSRRDPTPPGVEVSLTPAPASLSPYRYIFALRLTSWPSAEVVADRRLLSFVVHPEGSRRTLTCRHPDAPRRVPEGRVRTLAPAGAAGSGSGMRGMRGMHGMRGMQGARGMHGGHRADGAEQSGAAPSTREWREWVDLRMYCWGRAQRALEAGARVEVHYGYRRGGRRLWVARPPDDEGEREARSLEGADVSFRAIEPADDVEVAEGEEAPAVRVTMAPGDERSGASLTFRPRLRATGSAVRAYVRDDLFRYRIRGPLGETECALPRMEVAPIIDFYTLLGRRRGAGGTLASGLACPDAFQVAGVYEVTPIVDLVYDASGWDVDDVATGTFEGTPVPVRVRRGERGYVEQIPGEVIAPEMRAGS